MTSFWSVHISFCVGRFPWCIFSCGFQFKTSFGDEVHFNKWTVQYIVCCVKMLISDNIHNLVSELFWFGMISHVSVLSEFFSWATSKPTEDQSSLFSIQNYGSMNEDIYPADSKPRWIRNRMFYLLFHGFTAYCVNVYSIAAATGRNIVVVQPFTFVRKSPLRKFKKKKNGNTSTRFQYICINIYYNLFYLLYLRLYYRSRYRYYVIVVGHKHSIIIIIVHALISVEFDTYLPGLP